MTIVKNEQEEKQTGQFLKLENKSKLIIYSHLGKIKTHYLTGKNTSVTCMGDDCFFCQKGLAPRLEYFYFGEVTNSSDAAEGIIRIPATVFFALNDSEKILNKDKRLFAWHITKSGEGKQTKYGATRGDEVGTPMMTLEDATAELEKALDRYEAGLKQKYLELSGQEIFGEKKDEKGTEDVNPDDIPF